MSLKRKAWSRLCFRIPTIYYWVYCITSYWPLLLACVLNGYVFGIVVAQIPAAVLEVVGMERYPEGMAFVNMLYGLGILFDEVIGGELFRD